MADDKRKYAAVATFNANFQVGMAAPLDNRDVVRRYAHLVDGIGANHYLGQVVYVTGEFDSTKDTDRPTVDENNIVQSEVGYYYFKNETEGWVKTLTVESDGGSGGGSVIPTSALPIGVANGIAPLDGGVKIPAEFLPSYVDDVTEGYYYNGAFYKEAAHTTLITGETDKIYVDLSTEKTYRYSGSVYVEISSTQITNSFTTNIAVGGIPKGTTISTSDTLEDVLKKILINVYQPVKTTDASTSISKTSGSTPVKIGIKSGTYTFSITGDRGEVKLDGVSQGEYAGAISKTDLYLDNTSVKTVTSSTTPQTISVTVSSLGNLQIDGANILINDQPVSTAAEKIIKFKGGVTFGDGTQYNDSTGVPSSTLPAFVGQELQSTEISIEIVCPVYANTNAASVGTTVEQNAVSKSTIKNSGMVLTLPKHKLVMDGANIDWANSTPYTFEIPNDWTLSKVEWYNPNNGHWETKTSDFSLKPYVVNEETVYYHNITVNGVTVSYKTYYYNVVSPNIEQNQFKVFITY